MSAPLIEDQDGAPYPGEIQLVLADIGERIRQNAKWGEQNHADGTGPDVQWLTDSPTAGPAHMLARFFRWRCQSAQPGEDTLLVIALEEIAEAFAEVEPAALRNEVIQAAAMFAQWAEAIDRREVTP